MKMKSVMLAVFFLFCIAFCYSQDAAGLIGQGDELYKQRADLAKANEALAKYQEVLKTSPNHYEALWKISKTLYCIGKAAKTDKEKMKIFDDGVTYGKKAIAANPNAADGHFWLGVNWAKYGDARGVLKSLFLVPDVKKEMNEVLRLDSSYEGAGAYRVLGRVYYKVPGLFGGSNKKSREYLEKGRQICATNTLGLLYLAETYWDIGQKNRAVETLEALLNTTPDERWLPETAEDKVEAQKLLDKYKQKMK